MRLLKVLSIALVLCLVGCTGSQGPQGLTGAQGPQGGTGTPGVTGAQGPQGVTGAQGPAGQSGATGTNGINGANGENSLVALVTISATGTAPCPYGGTMIESGLDLNSDGILEVDEVQESADICDGAPGTNGTNGTNATEPEFTPIIVINPCGPNSAQYKEALLGLAGGGVFAEFTGGSSTTQVANILVPFGSYYDTDSSQCNFTIGAGTNAGDVLVQWDGSTQNGQTFSPGYAYYTAATSIWTETYGPIGD